MKYYFKDDPSTFMDINELRQHFPDVFISEQPSESALSALSRPVDIVPTPPTPERYQMRYWDRQNGGWVIEDRNIYELRFRKEQLVDELAEGERRKHTTTLPGQSMNYIEKAQQAKEVIGGGMDTPLIDALVGVELYLDGSIADTREKVAETVLYMRNKWLVIESTIDAERRKVKKVIAVANTAKEVNDIALPNYKEKVIQALENAGYSA